MPIYHNYVVITAWSMLLSRLALHTHGYMDTYGLHSSLRSGFPVIKAHSGFMSTLINK